LPDDFLALSRSSSAWSPIQSCSEVPGARASRRAVSAETARLPWTISCCRQLHRDLPGLAEIVPAAAGLRDRRHMDELRGFHERIQAGSIDASLHFSQVDVALSRRVERICEVALNINASLPDADAWMNAWRRGRHLIRPR
jgi:hypothetical protein